MNDRDIVTSDTGSFAPILGFALGAVVGGALALLLAPASGEQTRRRIGTATRRMASGARDRFDEARETVSDAASGLGTDMKSALDAGRDAFQHDRTRRRTSHVAETLNPPPTSTS